MAWVIGLKLIIEILIILGLVALKVMVRRIHECTHETQGLSQETLLAASDSHETISGLNQRLLNLENEIRLQKSDSSRLIEWLDKRDRELVEIQARFGKHLNLDDREKLLLDRTKKIVDIGESLRLLRK